MPSNGLKSAVISFFRKSLFAGELSVSGEVQSSTLFPIDELRFDFVGEVNMPYDGNPALAIRRKESALKTRADALKSYLDSGEIAPVRRLRFPTFYVVPPFSRISVNTRALGSFILESACRGVRFSLPGICPAVKRDGRVVSLHRGQHELMIRVQAAEDEIDDYKFDPECSHIHVGVGSTVQEGDVMATFVPDGQFNSIDVLSRRASSEEAWQKHIRLVMRSTAQAFQGRPAYRLDFVPSSEVSPGSVVCSLSGVPACQKFHYVDPSELIFSFEGYRFDFLRSFWQRFRSRSASIPWVRFLHGVGAVFPNGFLEVGGDMVDPNNREVFLTRCDRCVSCSDIDNSIRRTTNVTADVSNETIAT